MKFSTLIQQLGTDTESNSLLTNPNLDPELTGIAAVYEAELGQLSYIEGDKFAKFLATTNASALILPHNNKLQSEANERAIAWISVSDARLSFAKAIKLFYQPFRMKPGIHPTAVIDDSVIIGQDVAIGAHTVIESGVKIGDRACIFPNVVIYPDVTIGNNTIIHANVTIEERTQIGSDCVIHSGAVIGAEGFGFVLSPTGLFKMEQSGHVILGDAVEIGCNSNVDRPATGITFIGNNTKVDNLVQIGHGCNIGSNCVISALTGLSGKVTLGNQVILAGQVGITNDVVIGDGAIASAKAGVHHNVAPGEIVTGIPAIPHRLFLKANAIYNRLPELYKTLKNLSKSNS